MFRRAFRIHFSSVILVNLVFESVCIDSYMSFFFLFVFLKTVNCELTILQRILHISIGIHILSYTENNNLVRMDGFEIGLRLFSPIREGSAQLQVGALFHASDI